MRGSGQAQRDTLDCPSASALFQSIAHSELSCECEEGRWWSCGARWREIENGWPVRNEQRCCTRHRNAGIVIKMDELQIMNVNCP
jgi:hypothetical protein